MDHHPSALAYIIDVSSTILSAVRKYLCDLRGLIAVIASAAPQMDTLHTSDVTSGCVDGRDDAKSVENKML